MTFKTLAVAGCAMAAALSGATYALAQAPAAAAPPQVTHGAPVPGVCVFSGDGAMRRIIICFSVSRAISAGLVSVAMFVRDSEKVCMCPKTRRKRPHCGADPVQL